ncbi:MAG: hypothetical protein ACI4QI_02325 [Candidatus Coproplasma sp.]
MTDKDVNEELLKLQTVWESECYKPLLEEYKKNEEQRGKLSCAFSFGVSRQYMESDKKIMIVGQEANDHTYCYDNWCLKNWQEWAVSYLNRQVNREKNKQMGYNRSPFWRFFRKFAKAGYAPCWNNLDKVRTYVKKDQKDWKEDFLPYKTGSNEREILNRKIFDGASKSLLEKEIEIAKPNIVVFAVGPNNPYYHALSLAFFSGEDVDRKLENVFPKPNIDECYKNISVDLGLNVPAYWTYHPNLLSRKKWLNTVVDKIISENE